MPDRLPDSMMDTISATSITVTATARRMEAERLPQLHRQHFGVMHGGKDRAAQQDAFGKRHEDRVRWNNTEEYDGQKHAAAGAAQLQIGVVSYEWLDMRLS